MRKLTIGVMFVLASFFVAGAASGEGLVAHYPFDEGSGSVVRDVSGNDNHGTIHGATYVKLQEGYALEFDGEDDHVAIPSSDNLKLPDTLSVAVWVNTKFADTGGVVSKNGDNLLRQNYHISLEQGGIRFNLVQPPYVGKEVRGPAVTADRWYHIVGTYDAQDIKIYLNGKFGGVNHSGKFSVGTYDDPLYIGATSYGGKLISHFTGQIDDVRIYNRALSEQEIRSQYKAGKETRISKLSAMLKLVSSFEQRDTTPPTLSLASPPPDSTAGPDAVISAKFADAGSGIDVSSARILLDGVDRTRKAKISKNGFTLQPSKSLKKGVHRVEVAVSDKAGNRGNRLRWRFGVDTPVVVEAKFEQGVFLVSGEPFFPMGIYSGSVSSPAREKLGYLAQAAEAGINHALDGGQLDMYLKYGVKALREVYWAAGALAKGNERPLAERLKTKDHPALLGWWAEYSSSDQEHIVAPAYRFIKERDPNHPVLFMHTWAGPHGDVYFVYAYPILNPLLEGDHVVHLYNDCLKPAFEAAAAEGKGKQVWFISQAFDYRIITHRGKIVTLHGGFRPSREEIRAMNYLALAKGVKGLLYYAPGSEIPDTEYADDLVIYPRQWTEALKIAREVRHLAPVLAAGQRAETVRLEEDNPAIHYRELVRDGLHTLIAVNVERDLALAKWVFDTPSQPKVLFEDRMVPEKLSVMTDLFEPLEVHVYQWRLTASAP